MNIEKLNNLLELFEEKKELSKEENIIKKMANDHIEKKKNWNRKIHGILGVKEDEEIIYDDILIDILKVALHKKG